MKLHKTYKISILMLLMFLFVSNAWAQNKVTGKGERKGKWEIWYKGDITYLDYANKLLNLDKMLNNELETTIKEEINYVESVDYANGLKEGPFYLYRYEKRNGTLSLIANGQYTNGLLNGFLNICIGIADNRICKVSYSQGKMIDQDIKIEEHIMGEGESFAVICSQRIFPVIKIRNNKCVEEILTFINKNSSFDRTLLSNYSNSRLVRFVNTGSKLIKYTYGTDLLKGLVNVNYGLEVLHYSSDINSEGVACIYKETKLLYDTTLLLFKATIKNNKVNGMAQWLDSQNGKTIMECNYIDGKLNGVSRLISKSGKTMVETSYKDGILNGKFTSLFINDGSNLTLKGPICQDLKWDKKDFNKDLYQVIENNTTSEIFNQTIPMLRKKGHQIKTDGEYKFYEATYVDGKMQGSEIYFHSNGKKLYEGIISECKITNWKWFDVNGKQIYSAGDALTDKTNEINKQNNSLIPCNWCKKNIRYGDRVNLQVCSCFNNDGSTSSVYVDLFSNKGVDFCSKECRMKYEEECCRSNGKKFRQ